MDSDSDSEDSVLIPDILRRLKKRASPAPFSQNIFSQSVRDNPTQSVSQDAKRSKGRLPLSRIRHSQKFLPENPIPEHIDKLERQTASRPAFPYSSQYHRAAITTDSSSGLDSEFRSSHGAGKQPDFLSSPDIPVMISLSASKIKQEQGCTSGKVAADSLPRREESGINMVIAETSAEDTASEAENLSVCGAKLATDSMSDCISTSVSGICLPDNQTSHITISRATTSSLVNTQSNAGCLSMHRCTNSSITATSGFDGASMTERNIRSRHKTGKMFGWTELSFSTNCNVKTKWQTECMDSSDDDDDEDDEYEEHIFSAQSPSFLKPSLLPSEKFQTFQSSCVADDDIDNNVTLPAISSKAARETAPQGNLSTEKRDTKQGAKKVNLRQTKQARKITQAMHGSSSGADIESFSSASEEEGCIAKRLPSRDMFGDHINSAHGTKFVSTVPLVQTVELSNESQKNKVCALNMETQPYEDTELTYGDSTLEYSQHSSSILEQETQPVEGDRLSSTDGLRNVTVSNVQSLNHQTWEQIQMEGLKDLSVPILGSTFNESNKSPDTAPLLLKRSVSASSSATIVYGSGQSCDLDLTQPYEPVSCGNDSQGPPSLIAVPSIPSVLGHQTSGQSLPPPLLTKCSSSFIGKSITSSLDSSTWPALSKTVLNNQKEERDDKDSSMPMSLIPSYSGETGPLTSVRIKREGKLREQGLSVTTAFPISCTPGSTDGVKTEDSSILGKLTDSVGISGTSMGQLQALKELKTEIRAEDQSLEQMFMEKEQVACSRKSVEYNPIDLGDDEESSQSQYLLNDLHEHGAGHVALHDRKHNPPNTPSHFSRVKTEDQREEEVMVYMSDAEVDFGSEEEIRNKMKSCSYNHQEESDFQPSTSAMAVHKSDLSSPSYEDVSSFPCVETKSLTAACEAIENLKDEPVDKEEDLIGYTMEDDFVRVFDSDEEEMFSSFTQVEVKSEFNSDEEGLWADDISVCQLLEASALDSGDDEDPMKTSRAKTDPSVFSEPTLVDNAFDSPINDDDIFFMDTQMDDFVEDEGRNEHSMLPKQSLKKKTSEQLDIEIADGDFDDGMNDALFAAATQIDLETVPISPENEKADKKTEAGHSTSVSDIVDLTGKCDEEDFEDKNIKRKDMTVEASNEDNEHVSDTESERETLFDCCNCPTLVDEGLMHYDNDTNSNTEKDKKEILQQESKHYDAQTLADNAAINEDADMYCRATQRDVDPFLVQTQIDPCQVHVSEPDWDTMESDQVETMIENEIGNRDTTTKPEGKNEAYSDSDVEFLDTTEGMTSRPGQFENNRSLSDSGDELPDVSKALGSLHSASGHRKDLSLTKISSKTFSPDRNIESAHKLMSKINQKYAKTDVLTTEPQALLKKKGRNDSQDRPDTEKEHIVEKDLGDFNADHLTETLNDTKSNGGHSSFVKEQPSATSTRQSESWLGKKPDCVGPELISTILNCKPIRKRQKGPNTSDLSEVTKKARQDMEARRRRTIHNPDSVAVHAHQMTTDATKDTDMNTDVELPSTQEVFAKELPLIAFIVPVSKEHLAQIDPNSKKCKEGECASPCPVVNSSSKTLPLDSKRSADLSKTDMPHSSEKTVESDCAIKSTGLHRRSRDVFGKEQLKPSRGENCSKSEAGKDKQRNERKGDKSRWKKEKYSQREDQLPQSRSSSRNLTTSSDQSAARSSDSAVEKQLKDQRNILFEKFEVLASSASTVHSAHLSQSKLSSKNMLSDTGEKTVARRSEAKSDSQLDDKQDGKKQGFSKDKHESGANKHSDRSGPVDKKRSGSCEMEHISKCGSGVKKHNLRSGSVDRKKSRFVEERDSKADSGVKKHSERSGSVDRKRSRSAEKEHGSKADSGVKRHSDRSGSIDKKRSESAEKEHGSKADSGVKRHSDRSGSIDKKKSKSAEKEHGSKADSGVKRHSDRSGSIDKKRSKSAEKEHGSKSESDIKKPTDRSGYVVRKPGQISTSVEKPHNSKSETGLKKYTGKSESEDRKGIQRPRSVENEHSDKWGSHKKECSGKSQPGNKEHLDKSNVDKSHHDGLGSVDGKQHKRSRSENSKQSYSSPSIVKGQGNSSDKTYSGGSVSVDERSEKRAWDKGNGVRSDSVLKTHSDRADTVEPSPSVENVNSIKSGLANKTHAGKSGSVERSESDMKQNTDRSCSVNKAHSDTSGKPDERPNERFGFSEKKHPHKSGQVNKLGPVKCRPNEDQHSLLHDTTRDQMSKHELSHSADFVLDDKKQSRLDCQGSESDNESNRNVVREKKQGNVLKAGHSNLIEIDSGKERINDDVRSRSGNANQDSVETNKKLLPAKGEYECGSRKYGDERKSSGDSKFAFVDENTDCERDPSTNRKHAEQKDRKRHASSSLSEDSFWGASTSKTVCDSDSKSDFTNSGHYQEPDAKSKETAWDSFMQNQIRPLTPLWKAVKPPSESVCQMQASPSENLSPDFSNPKSMDGCNRKEKMVRFNLQHDSVSELCRVHASLQPQDLSMQAKQPVGARRPVWEGNPLQKRPSPQQEQRHQQQQQQLWKEKYMFKPLVDMSNNAGTSRKENVQVEKDLLTTDDLFVNLLKWSPHWFPEYERMLNKRTDSKSDHNILPPVVDFKQIYPLVTTYGGQIIEYQQIFFNLLLLETWEDVFKNWKEKKHKTPCHVYLTNCTPSQETITLSWTGILTKSEVMDRQHPAEGDLVILNMVGKRLDRVVEGASDGEVTVSQLAYVERVNITKCNNVQALTSSGPLLKHPALKKRGQDLFILKISLKMLYRRFAPSSKELVTISVIGTLTPVIRRFMALHKLPRCPLMADVLCPSDSASSQFVPAALLGSSQLNNEQSQAVITMLSAVGEQQSNQPKFFLLQGPPGTGKSHVIINFILKMLQKRKDAKICLAAPSNAAADELVRRLVMTRKQISVVRIGNVYSTHPDVEAFALENKVKIAKEKALHSRRMQSVPQSVLEEQKRLQSKIVQAERDILACRTLNTTQADNLQRELRKLRKLKSTVDKNIQVGENALKNQTNPTPLHQLQTITKLSRSF